MVAVCITALRVIQGANDTAERLNIRLVLSVHDFVSGCALGCLWLMSLG